MENIAAAKRNVFLLSAAQSVAGAAAPLSISIGGLAGFYLLGSDKSLATVPITAFNVGTALIALPAAMLMRRIGRRLGFMTGASVAICGMLIAGSALMVANFWMFALGLMFIGGGNSFTQQYRFAAADQGDEKFKVKAISWVLAGGVGGRYHWSSGGDFRTRFDGTSRICRSLFCRRRLASLWYFNSVFPEI